MLAVENIYVKYEHVIIDHLDLCCHQGITVLSGKSGSGKTTLLNVVALRNSFYKNYTIDEQQMTLATLMSNLYYVTQDPDFETDLTMRQNLDLLYALYHQKRDQTLEKTLLKRLDMEHVLDMYVNSLSLGEKKRFALICAIVLKRPVTLLDEPTSAVDKDMCLVMRELVSEYLRDRITIIATHDQELVELADKVYLLDQHQVRVNNETEQKKSLISQSFVDTEKYYWKTLKHKKFYHIISIILSLITIVSIVIGVFSVNQYVIAQEEKLQCMFSNQFVVYVPLKEGWTYSGDEYPLTDEQIQQLENLSMVKKVRPLYCISNTYSNLSTNIIYNGKNAFDESSNFNFVSYDDTMDVTPYVNTFYNEEGIYINSHLAESLGNISSGSELTFTLPVPQYNVFNEAYYISEDGRTPEFYLVYPDDHSIEVTMPIAGALNDENEGMGMTLSLNEYVIYIPQSIYERYIEEEKVTDSYNEGIVEYKPYEPNAYVVSLNSIEDIAEFEEEIEKIGLSVDSQYIDTMGYIESEQNVSDYQKYIVLGLSIGLLAVILITKYLKRAQDQTFFDYLHTLTQDNHYVRQIKIKTSLYRTLFLFLVSLIISYAIILIFNRIQNQGYTIPYYGIFISLLIAAIIEFLPLIYKTKEKAK